MRVERDAEAVCSECRREGAPVVEFAMPHVPSQVCLYCLVNAIAVLTKGRNVRLTYQDGEGTVSVSPWPRPHATMLTPDGWVDVEANGAKAPESEPTRK